MFSSELQPALLELFDVSMGDNYAAVRVHKDFSYLAERKARISEHHWNSPKAVLLVKRWIRWAEAIRQSFAQPAAGNAHSIERHYIERFTLWFFQFHYSSLRAVS